MKFVSRDGKVYGIRFVNGQEEEVLLFNDVIIEELRENIDDGTISAVIKYMFGGTTRSINVLRNTYQTKRNILGLQNKGLNVIEENAKQMVAYLNQQEEKVKIRKIHKELGFIKGKNSFRLYESIPQLSTYDGDLDIEPKGSYEKWLALYEEHIKYSIELQFMIVVALSSAVVGIIGMDISIENPIVHIYGDSSTGKTTAVQLALSCWGNPNLRGNGLMQNYNETHNSLMHNLRNNNGILMCFDEISMSSSEDFTSFIYSVANGKEKGRLSNEVGNGYAKLSQATWNTVILSTGEYNILERAKENDGLKVRVFAIGGVKWTKSAEDCDEIKKCVTQNYGYFGHKFAEYLMETSRNILIERHSKRYKDVVNALEKNGIMDNLTNRRSKYYAILIMVADILNSNFNFTIDIKGIMSMIKDIEKQSIENRDIGKQAYGKFLEVIAKNRRKFPIVKSKRNRGGLVKDDVWGYVLQDDNQVEIFPEEFKKQCRQLNFQSHNVILKNWKNKGLLDCESDRTYRTRKIGDIYVLNVYEEFINQLIEEDENNEVII